MAPSARTPVCLRIKNVRQRPLWPRCAQYSRNIQDMDKVTALIIDRSLKKQEEEAKAREKRKAAERREKLRLKAHATRRRRALKEENYGLMFLCNHCRTGKPSVREFDILGVYSHLEAKYVLICLTQHLLLNLNGIEKAQYHESCPRGLPPYCPPVGSRRYNHDVLLNYSCHLNVVEVYLS